MSMNGLHVWPAPKSRSTAGVAQPERRLALVDAGAKQFEFERGPQLPVAVGVNP